MTSNDHYSLRETPEQTCIDIKGTNAAIINLQQATNELNHLHLKLKYMESCEGELACTIFKWINQNTDRDNLELLEDLRKTVADKIVDNVKYWPEYNLEHRRIDHKLDFLCNQLFSILCHVDVHHEHEMLGYELGLAEKLGFHVENSKGWDYNKGDYLFARSEKSSNIKRFFKEEEG